MEEVGRPICCGYGDVACCVEGVAVLLRVGGCRRVYICLCVSGVHENAKYIPGVYERNNFYRRWLCVVQSCQGVVVRALYASLLQVLFVMPYY